MLINKILQDKIMNKIENKKLNKSLFTNFIRSDLNTVVIDFLLKISTHGNFMNNLSSLKPRRHNRI